MAALRWEGDFVSLLDQTLLPHRTAWRRIATQEEMEEAIRRLQVRGAPAVGIAGAFALYLGLRGFSGSRDELVPALQGTARAVAAVRPTAVNLAWAVNRAVAAAHTCPTVPAAVASLLKTALDLLQEDREHNSRLAANGLPILGKTCRAMTYCHTGAIATGGHGTALAILRRGWQAGAVAHVYIPETRPLLQGARLTAWELKRAGVAATLVTDNAAAWLMSQGRVDLVLVGADRITARGDVANKIGTLGLAILARHYEIPFYVAATRSTIDWSLADGGDIPIEMRDPREVTHFSGRAVAPARMPALAPAFDVTPAPLVTGIITELGVHRPPFAETLPRADPGALASP
ncbi:MAG: S-methyl-5-thioribose-1-phosphate isomerase [Candidatus Schekmanbacteria bacterium]|nr:S-methyl-5-thioribose-1-phosphate isomerase [Candidatus Schekmanbacteria bacterium]